MDVTELYLNSKGFNDEQFYAEIAKYPNLISLYCGGNQITNLDYLSLLLPKLQMLDCVCNHLITSLDHLPDSLQTLYCCGNQITNLNYLPPNLRTLICRENKITNLDHLPAGLQKLDCNTNQIINLDHLPDSLHELNCSYNKITKLDHLPASLQKLDCGHNKMTNLDHLPDSLQELKCWNNQMTDLDHLPDTLKKLTCWGNQVINLDHLPSSLQELFCWCNKVTSLDHLNFGLEVLYCSKLELKNLYLPPNIKKLWISDFKESTKFNGDNDLLIKKSKYLRFLRKLAYTRKTTLWLVLKAKQKESNFYAACLPDDIIKHITSFVF